LHKLGRNWRHDFKTGSRAKQPLKPAKKENIRLVAASAEIKYALSKFNMTQLWTIAQANVALRKVISKAKFTSFGCELHCKSKCAIIQLHTKIFVQDHDKRKKA
jgi:hypothetical protein